MLPDIFVLPLFCRFKVTTRTVMLHFLSMSSTNHKKSEIDCGNLKSFTDMENLILAVQNTVPCGWM